MFRASASGSCPPVASHGLGNRVGEFAGDPTAEIVWFVVHLPGRSLAIPTRSGLDLKALAIAWTTPGFGLIIK